MRFVGLFTSDKIGILYSSHPMAHSRLAFWRRTHGPRPCVAEARAWHLYPTAYHPGPVHSHTTRIRTRIHDAVRPGQAGTRRGSRGGRTRVGGAADRGRVRHVPSTFAPQNFFKFRKALMRTKPYTQIGIHRKKCFRCGKPALFQWQICSDGNQYRPVCKDCDIELNEMVLKWAGFPDWQDKIEKYKQKIRKEERQ